MTVWILHGRGTSVVAVYDHEPTPKERNRDYMKYLGKKGLKERDTLLNTYCQEFEVQHRIKYRQLVFPINSEFPLPNGCLPIGGRFIHKVDKKTGVIDSIDLERFEEDKEWSIASYTVKYDGERHLRLEYPNMLEAL